MKVEILSNRDASTKLTVVLEDESAKAQLGVLQMEYSGIHELRQIRDSSGR